MINFFYHLNTNEIKKFKNIIKKKKRAYFIFFIFFFFYQSSFIGFEEDPN